MLLLGMGVLAISTGSLLIRLADCPPLTKATWRTGLAGILLVPWAWQNWKAAGSPSIPWKAVIISGVLLATHFATWITSLETLSVASSVLLVNTAPLFVVLLGPWISKEARTPKMLLGVSVGFGGVAFLALAGGVESIDPMGARLAILGALSWAAFALLGKRLAKALPLLAYLTLAYLVAAITLGMLALAQGDSLQPDTQDTLFALVGLALIPQLVGHSLVNRSIRILPTSVVALCILMEPIVACLLVALFLGELPPSAAYWAAPLILGGILLSREHD